MMKQSTTPLTTKNSFERIIAGELAASFVFRDPLVCAFMCIHPYNPGHTLVVPTYPAASLVDLPVEYSDALFSVGHRILKALYQSSLPCEGVNLKLNDGSAAGQDVMRCHLHVIPRLKDDRLSTGAWSDIIDEPWDESRRSELDRIAAEIRSCLRDR
jgi:histidine triad (HIT) family protein